MFWVRIAMKEGGPVEVVVVEVKVLLESRTVSKSFCRFIRSCMEKNPANRPTCQQLLNDNHLSHYADDAYQENRRQRLKHEICDIVPDRKRHV